MKLILTETNNSIREKIQELSDKITNSDKYPFFHLTNEIELKALFGLLYYRALLGLSKVKSSRLFEKKLGHPIFGATMHRNRFTFLLGQLRFDDKASRKQRWRADRFAAIRELFEIFNENCNSSLSPTEYLALDETLYAFRGRIGIKQYNPKKPAKYGPLFQSINAVIFAYTYSICVVAGKPVDGSGQFYTPTVLSKVQRLVENLEQHVSLKGRNLTTDRYYTSIGLAKWLLEKNITLIGTFRANRQGIPPQIKTLSEREEFSYQVLWEKGSQDMSLHSYVVKTKSSGPKNILVLATRDVPKVGITKDYRKKKPAIINAYNFTNGGVDIQDQRMGNYSTSSKSKKFTRKVLSYLLDTARVNAQTIYYLIMLLSPRKSNSFDFLLSLAEEMVRPHIESRPLKGLKDDEIRKMSFVLDRPINKKAATASLESVPQLPDQNVSTRARRKAKRQLGPSAPIPTSSKALASEVVKFESTGKKRRCSDCLESIKGPGHKKAKDKLIQYKWQCCSCSKALCKKHSNIICDQCPKSFVKRNQEEEDRQAMQD